MSCTFGSKRVFLNQPAILLIFWLAIPLTLVIYLPPVWEWYAVAVSVIAGFLVTLRVEDASIRLALNKSISEGTPLFRDHSGRKILAFAQESLAVFNARPDALKAWQSGWEGWKDLEEKHGALFFYWNEIQGVQGGNPTSPIQFRFENEKNLNWFPASQKDLEITIDAATRFSPFPLKREEITVNGHALKLMHLVLLPMVLLSIMVFLIGIGLVQSLDASTLSDVNNTLSPLFLITWQMIHQVENWIPLTYFSELSLITLALTLWLGYWFSRRHHKEISLHRQEETSDFSGD